MVAVTGELEPGTEPDTGTPQEERSPSLKVTALAVLLPWKLAHPDAQFVPRPAARPAKPKPQPTPCKFFVNTGKCAHGDACPFEHGPRDVQAYVTERRAGRAAVAAASGDPFAGAAAAKSSRARIFAAWLVETYGKAALNAGGGVLDVAGGGSGGLAFELHCVHSIRVTVVDPRPPVLTRTQRAWLVAAGRDAAGALPPHVASLFTPDAALEALLPAPPSLVVGMHPDQASDAIVLCALRWACPFALVPCCVFPSLFKRLTPDGRRVVSRADLVAHLQAAGGGETAWLPFEGANVVVFRTRGAA